MANRSLLKNISANTNYFVDLNCKRFKTLRVTNVDSETVSISLAIGKDDNAGGSSLTNGAYVHKSLSIPQGVTLYIEGFDFTNLIAADAVEGGQKAVAGALKEDDYTLLIQADATDKLYSFLIEY